jgi:hypothetical protein
MIHLKFIRNVMRARKAAQKATALEIIESKPMHVELSVFLILAVLASRRCA